MTVKYIKAAVMILIFLLFVSILFDVAAGLLTILIKVTLLAAGVGILVSAMKKIFADK